jgi:hypothetical protein
LINYIFVKVKKWNPATNLVENYYTASEHDYNLVGNGFNSISNFSIKVEDNNNKFTMSNVQLTLANDSSQSLDVDIIAPLILGEVEEAAIERRFGIFTPFFETEHGSIIVAKVWIFAEHGLNNLRENLGLDDSFITGEVSSYVDFIELIEEDTKNVAVFVGHMEMKLFTEDIYDNRTTVQLLALDSLLNSMLVSHLDLYPLISLREMILQIVDKFPFIDGSSIDELELGLINWVVPLVEGGGYFDIPLIPSHLTKFDHFHRSSVENAKIITWSFNNEGVQEFYFKVGQRTTPSYWYKITLDDDSATSERFSSTPSKFIHSNALGESVFSSTYASYPEIQVNLADIMATEAPGDTDTTIYDTNKMPWFMDLPYGSYDNYSAVFIPEADAINHDRYTLETFGINEPFSIIHYYADEDSSDKLWFVPWDDTTTDNYNSEAELTISESLYNGDEKMEFIYKKGYNRVLLLMGDRRHLYSFTSPETGSYGSVSSMYFDIDFYEGSRPAFMERVDKIRLIGPHLKDGDDYPIDAPGESTETHYRKYPVWYEHPTGQNKVILSATDVGGSGIEVDDPYTSLGLDFYRAVQVEEIPSDMPVKPIFRYNSRNELEIWYYSSDELALKCYNWKMELKYAYGFGVDFERVALGRDKNGSIIIAITYDNQLVFARHQPITQLYYPEVNIASDETSCSDILTNLARWGFSAWFIARANNKDQLFFRPRYAGIDRGKIHLTSHSYKGSTEDTKREPNRKLTRGVWDNYADKIIVKSSFGIMATAGVDKTVNSYTYNIPSEVYHEDLGRRIAAKLLRVLGKRRELLHAPTTAFYTLPEDFVRLFDRSYCILELNSDYDKRLVTDLKAVNLSNPNINNELLQCIIGELYTQGGGSGWFYSDSPVDSECYCGSCQSQYQTLLDAIVQVLNTYELWLPDDAIWVREDDFAKVELLNIIYEYLYFGIEGDETIADYLEAFETCMVTRCGYE